MPSWLLWYPATGAWAGQAPMQAAASLPTPPPGIFVGLNGLLAIHRLALQPCLICPSHCLVRFFRSSSVFLSPCATGRCCVQVINPFDSRFLVSSLQQDSNNRAFFFYDYEDRRAGARWSFRSINMEPRSQKGQLRPCLVDCKNQKAFKT